MTGVKQQAREALRRGDVEEALSWWARATGGQATAEDLLEHGVLLHQLYRSREAMVLWERLLDHPEAEPGQWLAAGKLRFQRGCFGECVKFTGKAYAAEPGSPDTAAMHAAALERAGEKERAGEVAERALREHPRHARLVRLLAHLERRAGEFERARERLEKALRERSSEDDWRLRYELAAVHDRLGDFSRAMEELEKAKLQLEPTAAPLRPVWRAMTLRQWEVCQALSGERLRRWREGGEGLHDPVCLMGGFPRSGTTLLEKILASHPGCLGTDESGVLALQFRDPIVHQAASAAEAIEELDGYGAEDLEAGRAEYFRCTEDVLGEGIAGRVLLEKDPLMTADLAAPLRLFPGAKLLMPLRDPRDVVISFYFTIVPGVANSVASSSLEDSCRYYAEVMRHWLWLRERLEPEAWRESRYEDLLADPEGQTRGLTEFLGLPWEESLLATDRSGGGRPVGTPSYDDVAQPLYRRSLERWRRYEAWLEPHLPHLEPYLKAFGYD